MLDRPAYLERLECYIRRIADREERLLSFLGTPRSLDQIVAHRFIYRPGDDLPGIEKTERRSMSLHLERLTRDGRVRKTGERFVATDGGPGTASS